MVNRLSMDPKTYETTRYTLNDGTYWPKTTDNFWQDHNILSSAWNISENLTAFVNKDSGWSCFLLNGRKNRRFLCKFVKIN